MLMARLTREEHFLIHSFFLLLSSEEHKEVKRYSLDYHVLYERYNSRVCLSSYGNRKFQENQTSQC